ncbi:MAG: hypothetical protein KDK78_07495 [Chlamydiia bacterium]|nr:hypothetical protein [Chlamydiia bacterium]
MTVGLNTGRTIGSYLGNDAVNVEESAKTMAALFPELDLPVAEEFIQESLNVTYSGEEPQGERRRSTFWATQANMQIPDQELQDIHADFGCSDWVPGIGFVGTDSKVGPLLYPLQWS